MSSSTGWNAAPGFVFCAAEYVCARRGGARTGSLGGPRLTACCPRGAPQGVRHQDICKREDVRDWAIYTPEQNRRKRALARLCASIIRGEESLETLRDRGVSSLLFARMRAKREEYAAAKGAGASDGAEDQGALAKPIPMFSKALFQESVLSASALAEQDVEPVLIYLKRSESVSS